MNTDFLKSLAFSAALGALVAVLTPTIVNAATMALMSEPVRVVSGGIGEDESDLMKDSSGSYDVQLLFTGMNGEYLADVPYQIINASNQVVYEGVTTGPYVLANLPNGRYRVDAVSNLGVTQSKTIRVDGVHTARQQFRFPAI